MKTWDDLKKECPLTPEEEAEINSRVKLVGKLIELREKKMLTQTQFAELCGMKQSFVSRLESCSGRSMTVDTLIKLIAALGYEIDFIPINPAA